jgi:hypothetical protein
MIELMWTAVFFILLTLACAGIAVENNRRLPAISLAFTGVGCFTGIVAFLLVLYIISYAIA